MANTPDGTAETDAAGAKRGWRDALLIYLHRRVVGMFFLGFSAGLPLLLVFSTLTVWLRAEEVSRTSIGFFAWIGITYSVKVFWAPIVDSIPLPLLTRWLGRRRSWMLIGQTGIIVGLVGMAFSDPQSGLFWIALFGVVVAFSSSTQDIAIDAYRIEAVEKDLQAAMASTYILGYRMGMFAAGAGALFVAAGAGWTAAYLVMAAAVSVGVVTVLIIREPESFIDRSKVLLEERAVETMERKAHLPEPLRKFVAWFVGAVVGPFVDFFGRNGWMAVAILAFIGVFRISDLVMGIMANPLYVDLGYSITDIAEVTKFYGLIMTLLGAAAGGILVARFGIMRVLLLGAVMVAATNLLFAWLASTEGALYENLIVTITADNLSGGLATTAFIAYLSSLTNRAYTATQYALFSSLMTLPGKFISGWSGVIVDASSYVTFFIYASAMGVPAILLVLFLMRKANVDRMNAEEGAATPAKAPAE